MFERNNYTSWAQDSRCNEQLKVVDDMSYSTSLTYDSGCYEQLRDMDDMNDS